jgi:tRNA threonylcarbamoyladenosine biosynthesis protein TsaB
MRVLCIDTSGPAAGVALLEEERVLFEMQTNNGLTHSQSILPMVDSALASAGLTVKDIDLFAVVVGPGSFTGVRIGVSTVKALAHAAGRPCIGVDALEALAAGIQDFDGVICPILDARAQQVYGAVFSAGFPPARRMPDSAMKLNEYLDAVEQIGGRALFIGDGAAAFHELIAARLGEAACFAPAHLSGLRAASAAALALHRVQEAVDYLSLEPLYLRAPQAERERAAREAKAREGK